VGYAHAIGVIPAQCLPPRKRGAGIQIYLSIFNCQFSINSICLVRIVFILLYSSRKAAIADYDAHNAYNNTHDT